MQGQNRVDQPGTIALAERMSRLGTESAFDVLSRARALEAEGVDVIHLEIGEPDFDTPPHIVEAAVEALRHGQTHYTPSAGLPVLREAIADYVSRTRGVVTGADRVVVTLGGKPVIFYSILALAGPGDEVIYPDPGFPIYESVVNFAGAKPVPLRLREDKDFGFDPDELRSLVSERTKLVIVNSPHNPTGGIIGREALAELARLAVERDFLVMSDEIYWRITYEGQPVSVVAFPGMAERTIILDGFSKTYAMTGWRLGFGVFPTGLVEAVNRLVVNSTSCAPAFTQLAGVTALTGPQESVDTMVGEFRVRRDTIVAGLNEIPGITCRTPAGAFYAFPNVSALGAKSDVVADRLLNEAGVSLLSGTAFGRGGEGYLRLSYANSLENIQQSLRRIADNVRQYYK
ncbi:MAG TPA: pyridoxal phosphate-dependent aminotransferase [Thermomicrobiaceae bacterium]|nr:pyridoxal phosphate-dependent aminotransferase [Thermomicrobiaceae bacterium]